jgi:uncharacterized protein YceH (UPF0502 family)
VRVVYPGSGERSTRYRHIADEALGLEPPARAVLGLLLLRGPQTVGELRTRSERLHPFGSLAEVEDTLEALARHDPPVTLRLERRAGEREARWMQLLGEEAMPVAQTADAAAPEPEPGPERERVADTEPAARLTATPTTSPQPDRVDALEARVADLEERLSRLEQSSGAQPQSN